MEIITSRQEGIVQCIGDKHGLRSCAAAIDALFRFHRVNDRAIIFFFFSGTEVNFVQLFIFRACC